MVEECLLSAVSDSMLTIFVSDFYTRNLRTVNEVLTGVQVAWVLWFYQKRETLEATKP
jgi:hypothetical protein